MMDEKKFLEICYENLASYPMLQKQVLKKNLHYVDGKLVLVLKPCQCHVYEENGFFKFTDYHLDSWIDYQRTQYVSHSLRECVEKVYEVR